MKFGLLFAAATAGLTFIGMPVQAVAQGDAKQPQQYTVTDLGVLASGNTSGNNSSGFDMNNAGWVAGSSNLMRFVRGRV